MTQPGRVTDMRGMTLIDRDGQRIGKIDDLYVDDEDGQLEWALVHTGLFGVKKSFVPLRGATRRDGDVQVPVTKAQVKDAPRIAADGELSLEEEDRLYDHYGFTSAAGGAPPSTTENQEAMPQSAEVAASGSPDDAMTRSEEELQVGTGTQIRERGRARLRKYVVTEQQQVTVPVRREEAWVEHEPIDETNLDEAVRGPQIRESEHEVVLHEETPVIDKTVTPKERVRLTTETRQDEQTVTGDVRKEHIEAHDDSSGRDYGQRP
jgi:uncharacterized protein (TIGR02271 family)